jgi:4Fe-4S binding protein
VALTRTFIPLTPVPVSSPTGPRAVSATAGSRTGATPGMRAGPRKVRKPFTRRRAGHEQLIRQSAQLAFLLLNLWIGARFYLFVRYYEWGGRTLFVDRPPGVEGWLPIAALMNLKYFVLTGAMPTVHPAGMFLLVAFLSISLLFRKAFCSWLCPVGTISEWLWKGGEAMFGRSLRVWRPLDVVLRGLKYILLGLFLFAVGSMSSVDIAAFLESPYGLVADVKMLDFFRRMGNDGSGGDRSAAARLGGGEERVVPLPVPVWRLDGPRRAREPHAHSTQPRPVYRLRDVCEGLPSRPAGRPPGQRPIRGVLRVHAV